MRSRTSHFDRPSGLIVTYLSKSDAEAVGAELLRLPDGHPGFDALGLHLIRLGDDARSLIPQYTEAPYRIASGHLAVGSAVILPHHFVDERPSPSARVCLRSHASNESSEAGAAVTSRALASCTREVLMWGGSPASPRTPRGGRPGRANQTPFSLRSQC